MQLQVGVKALIQNDDSEYLLLQRSYPLPDGSGIRWDIPGGRINPQEHLDEALTREIHEETGLTLTGKPLLLSAQDIFIPGRDRHIVRLTYTVRTTGAIRLGTEHQAYRWVSAAQALRLTVDAYLRDTLSELAARLARES